VPPSGLRTKFILPSPETKKKRNSNKKKRNILPASESPSFPAGCCFLFLEENESMLLQSPLPSSLHFAYSRSTRPLAPCLYTLLHRSSSRAKGGKRECLTIVSGTASQVHSYGTVDFEKKENLYWNFLYRRIMSAQREGKAISSVLETWDQLERRLSKWELCRVAKELRKFRHSKSALEVICSLGRFANHSFYLSNFVVREMDLSTNWIVIFDDQTCIAFVVPYGQSSRIQKHGALSFSIVLLDNH
jgi:hypothetical protein